MSTPILAQLNSSRPLDDAEIDDLLSAPTPAVVEAVRRLPGDFMVLGVGGKMGGTTALMLRRALDLANRVETRVLGISRFSHPQLRSSLEAARISTVSCDLLDEASVTALPESANVLFLAGQKFGTSESPGSAWLQNVVVPALVARKFRRSRIVVFSTGCVYPFASVSGPGSAESDPIAFEGEYANTCVGRERVFAHFSQQYGTPQLIFRLNYSVELRYGVLADIANRVARGEPVDVSTGWLNCIWQGDACARAIQSLEPAGSPPEILNVTGGEKLSVRELAFAFGRIFEKTPTFTGVEATTAWLSDARKSYSWFGPPTVSIEEVIAVVARYIHAGGALLGKPTHFETRSGKF